MLAFYLYHTWSKGASWSNWSIRPAEGPSKKLSMIYRPLRRGFCTTRRTFPKTIISGVERLLLIRRLHKSRKRKRKIKLNKAKTPSHKMGWSIFPLRKKNPTTTSFSSQVTSINTFLPIKFTSVTAAIPTALCFSGTDLPSRATSTSMYGSALTLPTHLFITLILFNSSKISNCHWGESSSLRSIGSTWNSFFFLDSTHGHILATSQLKNFLKWKIMGKKFAFWFSSKNLSKPGSRCSRGLTTWPTQNFHITSILSQCTTKKKKRFSASMSSSWRA